MLVEECELVNLMVEWMLLRESMKIFRLSRPSVHQQYHRSGCLLKHFTTEVTSPGS